MQNLEELTKKLIAFRKVREWEQFHKPKDLAVSLSLEAAEVLEHFQWKSEKEIEKYVKTHKDEIGEELADVFNWVLLLSHDLGIDIISASAKKIEKNALKYPVSKSKDKNTKYTKL
ncbi:MAG: nucleotide pyrophosphohydrolase [Candidatus Taylorbacteria bacterium RIFCSPHIGHO2_02_49_25]|uniref:Nucleotide pyrophosphohydrolase n=1 Tax=Candidatus Taylorbacteria bacterium RIFCSPHIGHO2_02_49_25 TaxID=1802305 RepID=A0A1G2ME03_9BACT|nr:MAG: nucleotide pyrophosphohydrolase [Candidatus Taylorbacteria bacterium RIFCSPHIGHO2_01_FULL_49_60]OHA22108.1 MAG: nucleotide pyrophosphohydrolase [Candidatus Taylorbacteria bacterium RIFCSPHIGHO2_02_49_25]OHA35875.1 MAG: nucleotide pyrophosphohydrolase [Candidatus Taylorbacteria bacterium RIFCSPLOWO2_01_FULL_50_130]OHA35957.1 MAG: nucleotide pyrophosphohydrolase [Candidatus Taylorbacteria bacterium RIFCSPLOWO2_02_50_13]OHA41773.1 MAG: nucleotide pyrophosphohydrolase [Candidatus Taylorbact